MADEFEIAKDIKIELSIPSGTNALWNFAKWDNGEKWAAASSFTWTDIVATVSLAEIDLGGSVQNGYYVPATPNTALITFQSKIFDPANNKYIRPNTPIRLSYRANPDTAPSTYTILFNGLIDSFSTSYDAFGNNLVTVSATSNLKRALAKNLSTFTASGISDVIFFSNWCSAVGITGNGQFLTVNMATETFTNMSAGEVLDALLQVQMGIVYQDNTDTLRTTSAGTLRFGGSKTYTFSNTHSTAATHICISNIDVSYNLDESFNAFYINSVNDPSMKIVLNQDYIDFYGEIRCERTLHIDPVSISPMWLQFAVAKQPGLKVNSIETRTIRSDGKLAHVFYPGEYVGVSVNQTSYTISQDLWATRTTHRIDPDNWFTTLEVWKGF